MGMAHGRTDLPGIDPREVGIDRSAITDADLRRPDRAWWSFLVSDTAAVWTARLLSLLLWQLAGSQIDRIPTPIQVGEFLYEHRDLLWPNIWVTIQTAAVAMTIILVVGTLVGFAMGRWWPVRYFFTDLVMVLIALPAFIWALLAVMWWGFDDIGPIFVACISATPMLIVNTRQGAQAVDGDLQKMSSAYKVPMVRQFRRLVLPTMSEYIIAGFRFAMLAAWGAILLGRVLRKRGGDRLPGRLLVRRRQFHRNDRLGLCDAAGDRRDRQARHGACPALDATLACGEHWLDRVVPPSSQSRSRSPPRRAAPMTATRATVRISCSVPTAAW